MIQINNKTCFSLDDILDSFSPDMLRLYTYPLLREKLHHLRGCEEIANEVDGLVKTKQEASEFVRYACLVKVFFRDDANRSSEVLSSYIRGNLPVFLRDQQDMVHVAGGTFKMGSTDSDADDDEKTIHDVTLSDYYICQHTVTQQQWQKIMGSNPSYFNGDNLSVENVSWYDCVEYCNALSRHYGLKDCYLINGTTVSLQNGGRGGFRLPTEADWEFAARGGKRSCNFKYAGSDHLDEVAWYKDNSNSMTHPVCQKKSNELGLYDMSGNVWEWCWDWYDSYPSSPQSNPLGASSGSDRVSRGGSWYNNFARCRVSYRNSVAPDYRSSGLGMRLVLAL